MEAFKLDDPPPHLDNVDHLVGEKAARSLTVRLVRTPPYDGLATLCEGRTTGFLSARMTSDCAKRPDRRSANLIVEYGQVGKILPRR